MQAEKCSEEERKETSHHYTKKTSAGNRRCEWCDDGGPSAGEHDNCVCVIKQKKHDMHIIKIDTFASKSIFLAMLKRNSCFLITWMINCLRYSQKNKNESITAFVVIFLLRQQLPSKSRRHSDYSSSSLLRSPLCPARCVRDPRQHSEPPVEVVLCDKHQQSWRRNRRYCCCRSRWLLFFFFFFFFTAIDVKRGRLICAPRSLQHH